MKRLLYLMFVVVFMGVLFSSCSQQPVAVVPNDDVEGNIDISAVSADYADIGNKVWIDTNKDGIKQLGEAGFGGVVVNLYKDANPLCQGK